ncbi:alpha/beta hydrolase fold domain-containing protein [Micromonospora sp. WMMD558]|uniref:alpha/beta hydrolase fold domain-containing protein n=1 Tax=Micromonospora sp. WMMD558 TaxID=3403462 RepID=UPI003BF5DDF3
MVDGAVLLWVHGGGWHSRDTTDVSLFEELGMRVVQARYRLSGEATWPAQLDDVRAEARAALLPGRPLVVAGDSAGAHLALQVGLRGVDVPGDVDAVLALEPPVDPLAPDWPRGRAEGNPWHQLLGHLPAPGDAATVDCTVTTHVGAGTPVLLAHGLDDASVPVTQTLNLAAALVAAGHRVHVTVADGEHGQLDLRRPDLAAAVRRFLAEVTAAVPVR